MAEYRNFCYKISDESWSRQTMFKYFLQFSYHSAPWKPHIATAGILGISQPSRSFLTVQMLQREYTLYSIPVHSQLVNSGESLFTTAGLLCMLGMWVLSVYSIYIQRDYVVYAYIQYDKSFMLSYMA